MATPTLSASLDKTTYAPGDTATLTVTYADADNRTSTTTVTGTDQAGNAATATVVVREADPVALVVSDDGGRTWAKVSDNGSIAVFTTKV